MLGTSMLEIKRVKRPLEKVILESPKGKKDEEAKECKNLEPKSSISKYNFLTSFKQFLNEP